MTTLEHIHKENFKPKDVTPLLDRESPVTLSVFMPTHQKGEEVLEGQDPTRLKSLMDSIQKFGADQGMSEDLLDSRLSPLQDLLDNREFWRHRTQGLAIYVTDSNTISIDLPVNVPAEFRMSDRMHLVPLAPVLEERTDFFILSLELERIRLFKANRAEVEEIPVADKIPDQPEDRVGYDVEQKKLQHRTQQSIHGGALYHGDDAASRDRKNEILRFFREVDKGLQPILKKENLPLVIASQEYLSAIYQEASSYAHIHENPLICNLSEISDEKLAGDSRALLESKLDQDRRAQWDRFESLHGTGKASAGTVAILDAAYQGKVATLFVARERDLRGTYDPEARKIRRSDATDPTVPSLVNHAIRKTLENGGRIFSCASEDLPDSSEGLAAIFRY